MPEDMEVDENGKKIYRTDFAGGYNNPSDWCAWAGGVLLVGFVWRWMRTARRSTPLI